MKLIHNLLVAAIFLSPLSGLAEGESNDPITIGVALPLTGEVGTWGERIRQGLTLALEDTKHNFKLDYQDEGNCDAKATLSAVNKFLSIDHTKLLFMGCLSGTKAAGPLAKRDGAIMFSTGLLDEEVYALGYPVINLATQLATESHFLAPLIESRGFKRVALLRWPDPFGEEFARSLKAELLARKIEVPYDESAIMNSDYRSIIQKMKLLGVDSVATSLGDAQIRSLVKQLKESGLKIPVVSNYIVETNTTPSELLNGVEYTYPRNSAEGTSAKEKFDQRFTAKFGNAPSVNSYFAYDGLLALDLALDKCLANDSKCIFSFITANVREGLSGEVHFEANGSNIRPYGVKRVEQGRFIWVGE